MQLVKLMSGNTQITVDEADLELLKKAVWGEMLFLVDVMRKFPDQRERVWKDYEQRWLPMCRALGARPPIAAYGEVIRKGIEVQ